MTWHERRVAATRISPLCSWITNAALSRWNVCSTLGLGLLSCWCVLPAPSGGTFPLCRMLSCCCCLYRDWLLATRTTSLLAPAAVHPLRQSGTSSLMMTRMLEMCYCCRQTVNSLSSYRHHLDWVYSWVLNCVRTEDLRGSTRKKFDIQLVVWCFTSCQLSAFYVSIWMISRRNTNQWALDSG